MNSVEKSSAERLASLAERKQLMAERLAGRSIQPHVQARLQENVQTIQERAQEMLDEMGARLQESQQQTEALQKRIAASMPVEEMQQDIQAKMERVAQLTSNKCYYRDVLQRVSADLAVEKEESKKLEEMLAALREKIKNSSSVPFKNFLEEVAERGSNRFGHGTPVPQSHERRIPDFDGRNPMQPSEVRP